MMRRETGLVHLRRHTLRAAQRVMRPTASPAPAGRGYEALARVTTLLDSYIYGFAIQEASLPFGTPQELAQMAETVFPRVPAAEYPRLNEAAAAALEAGYDYTFAFGLELILDGLERLRGPA